MVEAVATRDEDASPRRVVRVVFWAGVGVLWAPLCVALGIAAAVALQGNKASEVAAFVRPGMPAAAVREKLGEPTRCYVGDEARRWLEVLSASGRCDATRVEYAWLYSQWVRSDAMVFLDASQRVVCPAKTGEIIYLVSH